jgi:hypothetical protein
MRRTACRCRLEHRSVHSDAAVKKKPSPTLEQNTGAGAMLRVQTF